MNTPAAPTAPGEARGTLRVAVDTPSHLFNRTVQVEIRDETMALVQRTASGREVTLPPGLYQVSAVLQDGATWRRIVAVEAGQPVQDVRLAAPLQRRSRGAAAGAAGAAPPMAMPAPPPPPPPTPAPDRAGPVAARPPIAAAPAPLRSPGIWSRMKAVIRRDTPRPRQQQQQQQQQSPPSAGAAPPQAVPAPDVSAGVALPVLQGAAVVEAGAGEWRLRLDGIPMQVATATVHAAGATWRISLPVGPGDGECLLRVDAGDARAPVSAWIAPERTMVAALQNMLLQGEYAALVPVAEQAIELLRSKYHDPTGATLGALILHKVGGLRPYAAWLENLARDFAWIPDANVLLASLLVEDHQQLDRALALAVCACSQRLLHAETHSILLDMLRRWPDRGAVAPHRAAFEALARQRAYVARGSLYLCNTVAE